MQPGDRWGRLRAQVVDGLAQRERRDRAPLRSATRRGLFGLVRPRRTAGSGLPGRRVRGRARLPLSRPAPTGTPRRARLRSRCRSTRTPGRRTAGPPTDRRRPLDSHHQEVALRPVLRVAPPGVQRARRPRSSARGTGRPGSWTRRARAPTSRTAGPARRRRPAARGAGRRSGRRRAFRRARCPGCCRGSPSAAGPCSRPPCAGRSSSGRSRGACRRRSRRAAHRHVELPGSVAAPDLDRRGRRDGEAVAGGHVAGDLRGLVEVLRHPGHPGQGGRVGGLLRPLPSRYHRATSTAMHQAEEQTTEKSATRTATTPPSSRSARLRPGSWVRQGSGGLAGVVRERLEPHHRTVIRARRLRTGRRRPCGSPAGRHRGCRTR